MNYYYIKVDENYTPPSPTGWYGKINKKAWEGKRAYEMPKHVLFPIEKHMQTVFTDVITFPTFMVSAMVRDVIKLYNPFLPFVRIIFFDKSRKKSMAYYLPFLHQIMGVRKPREEVPSVEREKLENREMIEVFDGSKTWILCRIDLLESILRRGAVGIGAEEGKIMRGRD